MMGFFNQINHGNNTPTNTPLLPIHRIVGNINLLSLHYNII